MSRNNNETTSADLPESPRTVLLAEDEHLVSHGMVAALRAIGFEVLGPAADGEQAIELCRQLHPDLALLDIRMPKQNGLDAAEQIFNELSIPVVIFSAYSDDEYVKLGNEIGVFGFLLKPVSQDQLRVGVRIAWGRYREFIEQGHEIDRLEHRLESRKVVEQAKWKLVQQGLTEPDAMKTLQRHARNNRRPLVEVAQSVLDDADIALKR